MAGSHPKVKRVLPISIIQYNWMPGDVKGSSQIFPDGVCLKNNSYDTLNSFNMLRDNPQIGFMTLALCWPHVD